MTRAASTALAALAAVAVLATGCYRDRYACTADTDCDLEGGRCELATGACSSYDPRCPAERRYAEHAGELTGTCFDDSVAPANPCAAGQPPARPEGCFAEVCAAVPACCATGWSDACVQQAQLRCELRCDTRIAITATTAPPGATTRLWDLRWTAGRWTATARDDLRTTLAWLAPAPGSREPRLAGFTARGFAIDGGDSFATPAERSYQTATSVDFDRAGRDTVALTYTIGPPTTGRLDLLDVDTGAVRALDSLVAVRTVWGDHDHDAFPDGIAGLGPQYTLLDNLDGPDHLRAIAATTTGTVGTNPTGGAALRSFDYADLDGDGLLELIAIGSTLRVHAGDPVAISDRVRLNLDCDPPGGNCAPGDVGYVGAALPARDGAQLVVSTISAGINGRTVYLGGLGGRFQPIATCATCPPFLALVARDLDGDRALDLVAIDAQLHVHTALAATGYAFVAAQPIAAAITAAVVTTSVSGAPLP